MKQIAKGFSVVLCLNLWGCGLFADKQNENKREVKSEGKSEVKREGKSVSTETSPYGLWSSECVKSDFHIDSDIDEFKTTYQTLRYDINDKKINAEILYYKDANCKERLYMWSSESSLKISKEDQNSYLTDLETENGFQTIYDSSLLDLYNERGEGYDEDYAVQGPFKINEPKELNLSQDRPFYSKIVIKDGKLCLAQPNESIDGSSESNRATLIKEDYCFTRINSR